MNVHQIIDKESFEGPVLPFLKKKFLFLQDFDKTISKETKKKIHYF